MRSPVGDLLADLARGMGAAGAPWFLFGAQAAILHGAARLTADVDITVRLAPPVTPASLTGALAGHGFRVRVADPAFIERTRVIPLLHLATSIPVDAVLAGPGLEDHFFARAVVRHVEGAAIPVASAEDVVIMKTLAGRDKDTEDIRAILAAQAEVLDLGYVRDTLRALESALGQSDLLDAFEALVLQRG